MKSGETDRGSDSWVSMSLQKHVIGWICVGNTSISTSIVNLDCVSNIRIRDQFTEALSQDTSRYNLHTAAYCLWILFLVVIHRSAANLHLCEVDCLRTSVKSWDRDYRGSRYGSFTFRAYLRACNYVRIKSFLPEYINVHSRVYWHQYRYQLLTLCADPFQHLFHQNEQVPICKCRAPRQI